MGLEQWGTSEQYYKIASVHPEYELGRVISQEKELNILFLILKNQDYRFLFFREDIKEMEKSNIMIRLEKKEEY